MPINFSSPTTISGTTLLKTRIGEPMLGEIVRVLNSGSTTQTYSFTDTYDEPATLTLTAGQIVYNLEKSGSARDSWNSTTNIAPIRLLITGSTAGSAFTEVLLTTVGAGSWTKPAGVTQVVVECWGAGGGGGGCSLADSGAGGGGGGQYARKLLTYSSPQQSISYNIGAGGSGGVGANSGSAGGDTNWNTTDVVAKGGGGGAPDGISLVITADPGSSIVNGSIGDVIYKLTDFTLTANRGIYDSRVPQSVGGRGSCAAGSTGGELSTLGTQFYELGANPMPDITVSGGGSDGLNGNLYGGGGGGAAKSTGPNRTGGNGAQGLIRLIYR